jgi:hypothetical protein
MIEDGTNDLRLLTLLYSVLILARRLMAMDDG